MTENDEEKDNVKAPDAVETETGSAPRLIPFLRRIFEGVFEGEIVSFDFFYRQWKACLVVIILLFCYIGNRYSCHRKMLEIEHLRAKEVELRYEATTLSSELTGKSRPSRIEKLSGEKGLDIHPAKVPSYKLKRRRYED
ncbi:MAG: hypothetical protein LUI04_06255 [Porphyromonadaceae bacterium]|nr:hypothetical protein [Porphyromonadaceae bacterium]